MHDRDSKFSKDFVATVKKNHADQAESPDEVSSLRMDQIEVESYVGGLVRSFERKAA